MTSPDDAAGSSRLPRKATVLESVVEVREQIRRAQTVKEAAPVSPPPPEGETLPFRPSHRPTMALLVACDDGDDAGETFRIRGSRWIIGRTDGNLVIPQDGAISGRHAEITRRLEHGQFHWYLTDLQSSNGTFVRVARAVLAPQQELLLGGRRYRFEAAAMPGAVELQAPPAATRKWQIDTATDSIPGGVAALVEFGPQGDGNRFALSDDECWIGRDPRLSTIVVVGDRLLSPRHARLHRDAKGRWHIENAQSLNGIWLRIAEIPLERGGHFQCGEQRFLIKIL